MGGRVTQQSFMHATFQEFVMFHASSFTSLFRNYYCIKSRISSDTTNASPNLRNKKVSIIIIIIASLPEITVLMVVNPLLFRNERSMNLFIKQPSPQSHNFDIKWSV